MPSPKTSRPCEGCGETFLLRPSQRWHSKECHGKYAMEKPKHKFVCANPECGIEYEKTAHQIGSGTGEFHSVACANKARAIDERVRFESYAHGVGLEIRPGLGPCVLWTGTLDKDAYGVFQLRSQEVQVRADRYAWNLAHPDAPLYPREILRHDCDNPPCVRLSHLRTGSRADNTQDMVDRDRQARGERMAAAKLTEDIVRAARLRYEAGGVTQQELADEAGVAQPVMGAALRRVTWRHVI